MGLKKFKLIWVDDVEPTYPGVEVDGKQKTYTFEVESEDDAKAFIRSFGMLNDAHNFDSAELQEVTTKENK